MGIPKSFHFYNQSRDLGLGEPYSTLTAVELEETLRLLFGIHEVCEKNMWGISDNWFGGNYNGFYRKQAEMLIWAIEDTKETGLYDKVVFSQQYFNIIMYSIDKARGLEQSIKRDLNLE